MHHQKAISNEQNDNQGLYSRNETLPIKFPPVPGSNNEAHLSEKEHV